MYIVAGLYRHRRLVTPKGHQTRPTASRLRESLFNICQNYVEGSRFLDLFAGSGAIGLEALSRGAQSTTFIEKDKEAFRCIQQNVMELNVKNQCVLFKGDVFQGLKLLQGQGQQFDLIFADPPYQTKVSQDQGHESYSEKLIRWIDTSTLLAMHGVLFVEEAFEFEPQLKELERLNLKSHRKMGNAILQQYQRVN